MLSGEIALKMTIIIILIDEQVTIKTVSDRICYLLHVNIRQCCIIIIMGMCCKGSQVLNFF